MEVCEDSPMDGPEADAAPVSYMAMNTVQYFIEESLEHLRDEMGSTLFFSYIGQFLYCQ